MAGVVLSALLFVVFSRFTNLVVLNLVIQCVNAILAPVILLCVFILSVKLPKQYALQGVYLYVVLVTFCVISVVAVGSTIFGITYVPPLQELNSTAP